jgi:hypothetical protein
MWGGKQIVLKMALIFYPILLFLTKRLVTAKNKTVVQETRQMSDEFNTCISVLANFITKPC